MAVAVGIAVALVVSASRSEAVTLEECNRTTHVSHGGEGGHMDLGAGRVLYGEWWSQEGVYVDVIVAHCGTGEFLRTRTREERISDRSAFDRTEKALGIIEQELGAAPELFSFKRLAQALDRTGEDIVIDALQSEPCACAAAYPDLRGAKTPFALN